MKENKTPCVALLTDFGTEDAYVGIMKGVMLRIAPQARLVDLTHAIPPGDIARAAFVLWQSAPFFPPGTVFLTVVDPGVGTARRAILLEAQGQRFVGPDNGVFSYLLHGPWRAWELAHPAFRLPQVSATFHGRDLFAPAAAYAALGTPGPAFGPPVTDPVRLPTPPCEADPTRSEVRGAVLHADRFGNLLTSLGRFQPDLAGWTLTPWLEQSPRWRLRPHHLRLPDGRRLPIVRTFGDLPPGEAGALVGSTGLLEIVVNRGSAAAQLGLPPNAPIVLEAELQPL